MAAIRTGKPSLATMLLLLLFVGSGCEEDSESWNNDTLSGLQTGAVVFGDRTRVTVEMSVLFAENASLDLHGQIEFLMAENTMFELPENLTIASDANIVFRSAGNTVWQKVRASHPVVSLHNITISGSIIGLDVSGAGQVQLDHLKIKDCEQYGLYAVGQDSLIAEDCSFSDCRSDATHIKFSNARFERCEFSGSVNGIYALDNKLSILDCVFNDNGNIEPGAGFMNQGDNAAYSIQHCLFNGNYYSVHDTANRDVTMLKNQFSNSGYFTLLFAHPFADRVQLEQNNILPGLGDRRIELTTDGAYRVGRHLPAENNWWGTTDLDVITSLASFEGDGRHTANSDTIRVEPILLTPVVDAGPRR
ncbi:MAG: right-handed parallel beta-helix repeat-containing protein [Candidatus Cloacimonetes bacterium]|nr:right-handed parallel beta-helix repeat-containing protein [Candidatus Cloacimonadota bacterium]